MNATMSAGPMIVNPMLAQLLSAHGVETVESDEEWERVAEAYDDLQFGSDEQP